MNADELNIIINDPWLQQKSVISIIPIMVRMEKDHKL